MGKPAARLLDLHICPVADGPKPHVGGPIVGPGCPTVLVGGQPAAVVGIFLAFFAYYLVLLHHLQFASRLARAVLGLPVS